MPIPPYELHRSQVVRAPREEVFAFFADVQNLVAMSPTWAPVRVQRAPLALSAGARIDLALGLGPARLTWETLITEFEPGVRFIDVQLGGPFRSWRHVHSFADAPNGETRVTDAVTYELPLGPLGRLAHTLVVRRQLGALFAHRARTMRERFG